MNLAEKRLRFLERRMKFLETRTDHGRNKTLSYDCEEMNAIKWVLTIVRELLNTKRIAETGGMPPGREN